MTFFTTVALLLLLAIPDASGASLGDGGVIPRCQCIEKESKPIGQYIRTAKVYPVSSHCEELEIIATLKKDGKKICLDPNAPWVKIVLGKKLHGQIQ